MLNNLWIQAGGMGLIAFLFWTSMRQGSDLARAVRDNTAATSRLVGLLEVFLSSKAGQADPAPGRRGDVA